jgi:hypothetical protein
MKEGGSANDQIEKGSDKITFHHKRPFLILCTNLSKSYMVLIVVIGGGGGRMIRKLINVNLPTLNPIVGIVVTT